MVFWNDAKLWRINNVFFSPDHSHFQISFWTVSDNVYSSHSYDSPKKDKKKLNKVQEKKPTIKEEDLTSEGMHHNILWYLNLDIHSDWP